MYFRLALQGPCIFLETASRLYLGKNGIIEKLIPAGKRFHDFIQRAKHCKGVGGVVGHY